MWQNDYTAKGWHHVMLFQRQEKCIAFSRLLCVKKLHFLMTRRAHDNASIRECSPKKFYCPAPSQNELNQQSQVEPLFLPVIINFFSTVH
jgi:hypothetical protein